MLLALACVAGISADISPPKDDFLGELGNVALTAIKSDPITSQEEEAADDFVEGVLDQMDAMADQKRAIVDGVEMARDEADALQDEVELKKDRAEDDVLAIKEDIDEFFKDTLKGDE